MPETAKLNRSAASPNTDSINQKATAPPAEASSTTHQARSVNQQSAHVVDFEMQDLSNSSLLENIITKSGTSMELNQASSDSTGDCILLAFQAKDASRASELLDFEKLKNLQQRYNDIVVIAITESREGIDGALRKLDGALPSQATSMFVTVENGNIIDSDSNTDHLNALGAALYSRVVSPEAPPKYEEVAEETRSSKYSEQEDLLKKYTPENALLASVFAMLLPIFAMLMQMEAKVRPYESYIFRFAKWFVFRKMRALLFGKIKFALWAFKWGFRLFRGSKFLITSVLAILGMGGASAASSNGKSSKQEQENSNNSNQEQKDGLRNRGKESKKEFLTEELNNSKAPQQPVQSWVSQ